MNCKRKINMNLTDLQAGRNPKKILAQPLPFFQVAFYYITMLVWIWYIVQPYSPIMCPMIVCHLPLLSVALSFSLTVLLPSLCYPLLCSYFITQLNTWQCCQIPSHHYLVTRAVTIHKLTIRFVSRFLTHGSIHPTIFLNLKSILFKQQYNN